MFVFKAAVVGAGVMGGEIAQVIASAGVPVVLKDVDGRFVDAGLQKARAVTEGQVAKLVEKGKLTREQADEQRDSVLRLITPATAYDEFGDVDFVVEAVPEKMAVKHAVFAELDSVTPGHAILSSNTSGLSITEIGDAVYRPDKVVGFHFFWPAARMRLIEIVEGDETSPETMRYQDETGTPIEAIDEALTASGVAPMGPFRLADMSGLDTALKVAQDMRDAYGDRFYVHRGMEDLVAEGHLGAKSGKGFYEHA
jgi:3-hydroxyacyl-CoA dehydrogenase